LREGIAELKAMRERWTAVTNEALQSAGLSQRVDHRSLAARGIDRFPRARVPWSTVVRERKGLRSEIGERIRANHLARVQAKRERALKRDAEKAPAPERSTLAEVRRQAREAWTQLRQNGGTASDAERRSNEAAPKPSRDDDLSL
jgi:hypothetical protein